MTKLIDVRRIAVLMLAGFLCGCSASAGSGSAQAQAHALNQADKFVKMAGKGNSNSAMHYRMRAAEQYVIAEKPDLAQQLLNQNFQPKNKKVTPLSPENSAYKQIILAKIALAKNDPEAAQTQLRAIWTPSKLPEYLKIKFYSTRSDAFQNSNRNAEAIQERIFLAKHITNQEEQKTNNTAIWEILNESSDETLNSLHASNSSNELTGWIAFTKITKQHEHDPRQMNEALSAWQSQYPQHPAISFVPENLMQPETTSNYASNAPTVRSYSGKQLSVPHKIALLLPLKGTSAQSAQAVRDGFMAAYNSQADGPNKPVIQVFDTSSTDLYDVYHEAMRDGAEFIVGPLIKEEVETLSNGSSPRIPVLALNIIPKRRAQDNVFQFGLSPEMEAQAVADRAWRDGRRNALIIAPKSAWGARMTTAFEERWQELGGNILASHVIQSQTNINKEIQSLLAIDSSEARAKELKQLGIKFSYETRRRQDPDMIFIATNAALARQVKPLLNFYYAGKLPAYASSSVFSGTPQPSLDHDLNGIVFCDMPWVLDAASRNVRYSSENGQFEQYGRLYALGLDAYKIALQIDQLTLVPDFGLPGMTGKLTLDSMQNVQRKLLWAKFKNGTPVIERENM